MLEDFLQPIDLDSILDGNVLRENEIGANIEINQNSMPGLEGVDMAIIGVCEDSKSVDNKGCGQAPNEVRKYFYQLDKNEFPLRLIDLGNLMPGATINDTHFALGQIVGKLLREDIVPIIIGGSHDLTYGQYLGYVNEEILTTAAVVDERIDVAELLEPDSSNFLYKVFTTDPGYITNYCHIGYQSHFVPPQVIDLLSSFHFDFYRLADVRDDFEEVEPAIRNANLFSFDVNAIRMGDAPGRGKASPNGFHGEEACRLARYAGITNKATSIGFYEVNPMCDNNGQTAHLVAQMMWYFVEGYYARTHENIEENEGDFFKYVVENDEANYSLTFWKSKRSGRWWMQMHPEREEQFKRLIPCSYNDYQTACQRDLPDRWVKTLARVQ